jgi:glycosyltransferase involved in cell wall biosynthesis
VEAVPAHVRPIGYVRRRDLPALYHLCDAFVFPSLSEGFGLPVLEALACGAPVVTSPFVPLPRLADVALLSDPCDAASIAAQIERVLTEPNLRTQLGAAGREYARPYTWRRTAEMTLEVYEGALEGGRS